MLVAVVVVAVMATQLELVAQAAVQAVKTLTAAHPHQVLLTQAAVVQVVQQVVAQVVLADQA
jgi:hypothetical protein